MNFGFIGKIIFAIPMALFGFFHFMGAKGMTDMVPSFLPVPIAWVYFTGLALILSSVAIIINKKAKLATTLLSTMLLLFAVLIHLDGFMNGEPISSSMFLKDIALAGGALFISSHLKN
jgi:uncharacterized membrane protein